jgi:hypothetical protein
VERLKRENAAALKAKKIAEANIEKERKRSEAAALEAERKEKA